MTVLLAALSALLYGSADFAGGYAARPAWSWPSPEWPSSGSAEAEGYDTDPRFKANFDRMDPRLAGFMRQAVAVYVARRKKRGGKGGFYRSTPHQRIAATATTRAASSSLPASTYSCELWATPHSPSAPNSRLGTRP